MIYQPDPQATEPDDGINVGHDRWSDEGGHQGYLNAFWTLGCESASTEPRLPGQAEQTETKQDQELT
jgi:hypothetical protein